MTDSTALAMRVHRSGEPLQPDRIAVRSPGPHEVRIMVVASGVCGADIHTAAGPSSSGEPVTPGHEVSGVIADLGAGVTGWRIGDRVAVGWLGGSCGQCEHCRRGDPVHCPDRQVPGLSYPGGWSETITVPAVALARVPDDLDLFDAAPMGCAGVTTFNAVRRARVRPGGTIAVFGLGGLGHLAVQFAVAMGHRVVTIARGAGRAELARALGATHHVDSTDRSGAALRELGGVDAIVFTAPATDPVGELMQGLRPRGHLVLVGIGPGDIALSAGALVMNALSVTGHLTGGPADTEQAMRFAVLHQVRPVIERMPLEQASRAVERLRSGEVRGRVVLDARPDRDRPDPGA